MLIKIRGIGGKTHIANERCCDERGAVAICATRLKGDFVQGGRTDGDVTCGWCATRTHLLEKGKVLV